MSRLLSALPYLVVAAVVFFVGKAFGGESEPVVVTRVDTVTTERYASLVDELRLERDGLRARIEGLEARPPRVVTRTDTLYLPAVAHGVVRVEDGSLTVEVMVLEVDSLRPAYRPELRQEIDVSDCDEGYSIQDGEVVCDPAQLGHLYLTADAGLHDALAGLEWEPSYRSLWEISVGRAFAYDRDEGDRWKLRIRRRVELW